MYLCTMYKCMKTLYCKPMAMIPEINFITYTRSGSRSG